MALDFFTTREMVEAVQELKPMGGFFKKVFFNRPDKLHIATEFDIDIIKGSRRIPAYSQVTAKSIPFDRDKMTTKSFTPPCLKPSRAATAIEAMLRSAGSNIYSPQTPSERAGEMLMNDLAEMSEGIDRAEEKQATEAIVNGVVVIKGDDTDAIVDMRRDPSLVNIPAASLPSTGWTVGAELNEDFRFIQNRVFRVSGFTPTVSIMNYVTMGKFLANTSVQKYMDNRRIDIGQVNYTTKFDFSAGVYRGNYMGVDLWEYNDGYEVNGVFTPYVADNVVVMGSPEARCTPHYGAIVDHSFYEGAASQLKRFSKSWVEEDPSIRKILVQSHPIMVTENSDAFCSFLVA